MTNAPVSLLPKWQVVTGWVLTGIPGLAFLPSAYMKIAQPGTFLEEWSKGYPASSARPIGLIEITLYVMCLVPRTRLLGLSFLTAYLGGAVATHLHMAQFSQLLIPVLIGVMLWAGLWLRDARLRELFPLAQD